MLSSLVIDVLASASSTKKIPESSSSVTLTLFVPVAL